jgi:FAD/FMN-containing dehydrogenase
MLFERRGVIAGMAASLSAAAAGASAAEPTAIQALRSQLKGGLILPGDAGYERARRGASFGPTEDRRPAAIVQCADEADVARAIAFARAAAAPIAVKSGGHDVLADCTAERGVVIDLSPLQRIAIDPATATARVGAGVRSAVFAAAAKPYGLAPALGCNPAVGVAGLTLGGGLGWLLGTRGAACDNLLSATLVTAEGRTLEVSAQSHPDLFWGLRGGGGNFGVVTELRFQLHPLDTVLAGAIGFSGDLAAFLRFYREVMAQAPDALAVELSLGSGPQPAIVAIVCASGDRDEANRALASLRSFGKPTFDTVQAIPYGLFAGPGPASGGGAQGGLYWRGGSLDRLSDEAIAALAAAAHAGPPNLSLGLGHYLHGAICRVSDGATPLRRRAGQLSYFIGAGWRDPAQGEASMAAVTAAMTALRPVSSAATYINYLSSDAEADVRAAYGPAAYGRLQRLKDRYDPENLFRLNRNVRPSRRA